jgi:hypothetical protein
MKILRSTISKFQVDIILIILTMMYTSFPEFLHLIFESLCPLTTIFLFSPPFHLWQLPFCSLLLCVQFFQIPHLSEIMECSCFHASVISLSITFFKIIYIAANGMISFYNIPLSLSIHLLMDS